MLSMQKDFTERTDRLVTFSYCHLHSTALSAVVTIVPTHPWHNSSPGRRLLRQSPDLRRKTTDKLQRVLNSAARIVSNTRKFDRGLTHFRISRLHWMLSTADRVWFRVCIQVFRCLHKMAPECLSTYCQPDSGISGRCHLRSADRGHLDFPRVKFASYGKRSFAYAGRSNWNSLPAYLRDSSLSLSPFKHHLKTFLFSFY